MFFTDEPLVSHACHLSFFNLFTVNLRRHNDLETIFVC